MNLFNMLNKLLPQLSTFDQGLHDCIPVDCLPYTPVLMLQMHVQAHSDWPVVPWSHSSYCLQSFHAAGQWVICLYQFCCSLWNAQMINPWSVLLPIISRKKRLKAGFKSHVVQMQNWQQGQECKIAFAALLRTNHPVQPSKISVVLPNHI